VRRRFEDEYARLYGEGSRLIFRSPEIFTLRVRATVRLDASPLTLCDAAPRTPAPEASLPGRKVYWPSSAAWEETSVYDGRALVAGDAFSGPAVVELAHTTVAVAPGQSAAVDGLGSILISL
jgi:N-methylhydantoinase A